jgi:aryl-alcohol dehydrogenase-like predicted oxidoreductase
MHSPGPGAECHRPDAVEREMGLTGCTDRSQPGGDAAQLPRWTELGPGRPRVLRLGLATRGNTHLDPGDVACAVARGVNYLNWCGYDDGLARALREGRVERQRVVLAMQLESRDGPGAARELAESCRTLGTDRIDVVTFYYVEDEAEWAEIVAPGGALEALDEARRTGRVGLVGMTTHQRKLGARSVESGKLELLMIRYNAAHRGAEQDVFPVTDRLRVPVVAFTAQRWGWLRQRTPSDPPGSAPPPAREWYRFVLAQPSVSVVLMAPANRQELEDDLSLLEDWRAPRAEELDRLTAHGRRVRRHAGAFP